MKAYKLENDSKFFLKNVCLISIAENTAQFVSVCFVFRMNQFQFNLNSKGRGTTGAHIVLPYVSGVSETLGSEVKRLKEQPEVQLPSAKVPKTAYSC